MQFGPVRIVHTLGQLSAKVGNAAQISERRRPQALKAIGVQVVSWGTQDFIAKGRGGADATGERWAPLKPETVKNRIRRLAAYRKLRDQLHALRNDERALRASKAKGKAKQLAAI